MSDDVSTSLASNLRRLRDARGLSQQALAERSGVPRPTIAHLETGQANPTLAVVTKLARSLGVSLDGLVEDASAEIRVFSPRELKMERRGKVRRTRLLPEGMGREIDVERIVLAPGGRCRLEGEGAALSVLCCEAGELALSAPGPGGAPDAALAALNGGGSTRLQPEQIALVRGAVECTSAAGGVVFRVTGLSAG